MNPWKTTSAGTGELIRNLLEMGATQIYVTVGGSATVDGAVGILQALGARFYQGPKLLTEVSAGDLRAITQIEIADVKTLLRSVELTVLCDVYNPLLGQMGAASIFGPQKGAGPADIPLLEQGLSHLADLIFRDFGVAIGDMPHAGAAGGVAGVLHGVLGARLVPGGETIMNRADFDLYLAAADVVITGEGRIDEQSAYGKAPGLVARKAHAAGRFVIGLSGAVAPEVREFADFDVVWPISHGAATLAEAYTYTAANLERSAMMVAKMLRFQCCELRKL